MKLTEGSFPDYVFDDDYKLLSLAEVKQYIDEHKHLPNMPSAEEVEQGDMNLKAIILKQQEKIEELTLYLLEEEKLRASQQTQIADLSKLVLKQSQEMLELKISVNQLNNK